jgi:hypothetical protein
MKILFLQVAVALVVVLPQCVMEIAQVELELQVRAPMEALTLTEDVHFVLELVVVELVELVQTLPQTLQVLVVLDSNG